MKLDSWWVRVCMAGQGAWSSNRPWRPTGGRTSSPTSLTEMAEKMEVLGSSLREREREPRVVTPVIRPLDLTLVTITEVVPAMALPPYFPPGYSRAPLVLTQFIPCRTAVASRSLVTQVARANCASVARYDHTEDLCCPGPVLISCWGWP